MRVTIITTDQYCAVDGEGYYGVDMSSVPLDQYAVQWYETWGEVEYRTVDGYKPPNTRIDSIEPYQPVLDSWAVKKYEHDNPPYVPPTAAENKAKASSLLYETDWTQIPSVSDPALSNPYLINADEFANYRNQLRAYVFEPVAGDLVWPIQPNPIWA